MTPEQLEQLPVLLAEATPREWVNDDNEGFSLWRIWAGMAPSGNGKAGRIIADVHGDSAEDDANAALIAAAPDLAAEVLRLTAEVEALRKREAEAVQVISRSAEGWGNALELGLIPERHKNTALILCVEARAFLAGGAA